VPFSYEHPRPAVTVDACVFTMRADDLAVLLIRRKSNPFKGLWAIPGGFVDKNETLEHAAARELGEETGLSGVALEQLAAFGDPGRDPRGHTVSVAFFTFAHAEAALVRAGDDASEAAWHPLRKLPRLAFDHAKIVAMARRRLQERLRDPARESAFQLVPQHFTLTELQKVYEAIIGRPLDKRNFRARFLGRAIVEPVAHQRKGRHRPAQLYRWATAKRRS
jgi:ADP-ribose pyrophosphatase YjhB (NUDIX family)